MADIKFRRHFTMIVTVLGMAIGTGNIWRFPRILANNLDDGGGGAFLLAWILFLVCWSVPLLIAEYLIGRYTKRGPIASFFRLDFKKRSWIGGFIVCVTIFIMFYYSVVAGWCLYYLFHAIFYTIPTDYEGSLLLWNTFQSGYLPVLFHIIICSMACFVVIKGIKRIEKWNLVLIPLLAVILLISLIRGITLPNASVGLELMFSLDITHLLNARLWLDALTQNAWDTGAGWGLLLCYAIYMRSESNVIKSAWQTGIGNNLVSLTSALIIFSIVFGSLYANQGYSEVIEIMRTSGPASTGLTFIWMPQLFQTLPFGNYWTILFFMALSCAAFSSLISMIELSCRALIDIKIHRKKAILIVCICGCLFGIPSALWLDFLVNQDFVWGIGLMVSGGFIGWLITSVYKRRNEYPTFFEDISFKWKKWVLFMLKIIIPIEVIALLGWWFYASFTSFAPEQWNNPFALYSVATIIMQWMCLILILKILNKHINKRILKNNNNEG